MLILIAQKKRLGALNATQKNHKSLPSTVTEKIKKKHQNVPKTGSFKENFHFLRFFVIFSVTILGKDLWFSALRSVPQDASFELSKSTFRKNFKFFTIGGTLLIRGGQNKLVRIYVILPRKQDYF